MNAEYYTVKGARRPIIGVLILTTAFATLFSAFLFIMFCLLIEEKWKNLPSVVYGGYNGIAICGVVGLIMGAITFAIGKSTQQIVAAPLGTALNPVRPNVNEILPEAEVLVRASVATDAAQRETLLRPAAATDETAPQTLLRAANGKAND